MSVTKYQVRGDQTLSEEFEVVTGLKQKDVLLPLFFNIELVKVIRSVQDNNLETSIGATRIGVLVFADDLNLIGDSKKILVQITSTLVEKAESIVLKLNQEKTKKMVLLPNEEQNIEIGCMLLKKSNILSI